MRKVITVFLLYAFLYGTASVFAHGTPPAGSSKPEADGMLSQLTQQNFRDWTLVESILTTVASPTGLAYDGQVFYAGNWNGSASNIQKIDPNTGATIGTIPSPAQWPGGLTWDGANIWVTDYVGGMKLFKIDPNTGAIITQFPVTYSYFWAGLAWDGANLLYGWNGNPSLPIPGSIIKYSPTGAVLDSMVVPGGYISGLEYYDGYIYYSDSQNDKLFKMLWGGTLIDSTPAANGYPSGLCMQGELLCNLDHTSRYIYKYSLGAVVPPDVSITLTPISPPIIIPPGGGSFDYDVMLANGESSPVTFDAWITAWLPSGSPYPALGPLTLTLSAGANITRLRTQGVPASAPPGTYAYVGYVGEHPSVVYDSSYFSFEKSAAGEAGIFMGDWINSGQSFDMESALITTPAKAALHKASPNPFNPTTTISYELAQAAHVTLAVYNLRGREVAQLVNGFRDVGSHQLTFDGSALASGIYIYSLSVNGQVSTAKIILMK